MQGLKIVNARIWRNGGAFWRVRYETCAVTSRTFWRPIAEKRKSGRRVWYLDELHRDLIQLLKLPDEPRLPRGVLARETHPEND